MSIFEQKEKELKEKEGLTRYEDAERKQLSDGISGAIYKVMLDSSHPVAFGLKDTYYTLKTNELRYGFLEDGWNVGVIRGKAKPVQGFAGTRINKSWITVWYSVWRKKGRVISCIWWTIRSSVAFGKTEKMLFANAGFMVGQ